MSVPGEDGPLHPGGAEGENSPQNSHPDIGAVSEEAGTQADLPYNPQRMEQSEISVGTEDCLELMEKAPDDRPDEADHLENTTATVKVVLVPEGHVMTVAFSISLSVQELKRHLASELRTQTEGLQLHLEGRVVEGGQTLMDLGVRPHSSVRMELSSTDPGSRPLCPPRPAAHSNMADVITVRVQKDGDVFQEVVVEIERSPRRRPFLGGYRHRRTGVEFHHAAVQTLPKKRPDRGLLQFSRGSQTVKKKSQTQQCEVDSSTQMSGIGCYVSCVNDKLLTPGKWTTAEEHEDQRLRAVVCLQSYARRWLARRAVERLRRERSRRLSWLQLQEKKRQQEKEEQLRDRRQRWMNPQKKEDFNLLYHALEKWRNEEEMRINMSLRGSERKEALCSLLEQESQLIAAIGCHRITVETNNHQKIIKHFLDKSASPLQWRGADGRLIEMDTQDTLRARELRDLYNDISRPPVGKEQRVHFLKTLKDTVKDCECQLTQDILDLIEREVDLMTRGVKTQSLEGLRRRICTLFLQFVKTPTFNPKVAKLLKVPQNPAQLRSSMFLCRGCGRYLRSADFGVSAGGGLSDRCLPCSGLNNEARARHDFSLFRSILGRLRADEQQLNPEAKIPFLLQVEDIRYLVEVLWASHSAINGSRDLYHLVLVRWDRRRAWSPWNCILLSKEETAAHLEVDDIHKAYERTFILGVEHKHTLAHQHFGQIPRVSRFLPAC